MLASSGILWLTLRLPPSDTDRVDELAALLEELRVPAAVRHSIMNDSGTFALVPSDDGASVLMVADSYAPTVDWSRLSTDDLSTALTARFGSGITLNAELLDPHADPPHAEYETNERPAIDAIAWTTREEPELIAMLGARYGMSFDAVDAGDLGRALRPHLEADRDRALHAGIWALTDGIALWRRGSECAAVFMGRRRQPHIATWHRPWVRVDPSKPGQRIEGALVQTWLDDILPPDGDAEAWIAQFGLDTADASRLRALFRRDADPRILDDLLDFVSLDRTCLELLRRLPDPDLEPDLEVIHARTARKQFRDGIRAEIDAIASRPERFRHRNPRLWLTISIVAILVLGGFAITGLVSGRMTAILPGIVALVWTASLFVDRAVARAKARVFDEDLPEASRLSSARPGRDHAGRRRRPRRDRHR